MQWRPRVRKSPCPEKLVGRVSLFLRTLVGTAASLGQGTYWPGLEGMGPEAESPFFLHMPSSGDCRIPPALEAGDLGHPDRNSHLPGVSCSLQCLLSLKPCPQPSKRGTAQAQIRSPGVHLIQSVLLQLPSGWNASL